MTRDEAIELAAHYMGGLLSCDVCERCAYEDYMSTQPEAGYDDLALGLWVLGQGWEFRWQEFDHEGAARSGKFPFMYFKPASPESLSWSFSLICPECVLLRSSP